MFSKIKKVLVSLALASSLALAPMNVSADDDKITLDQNTTDTKGDVFGTGSQFKTKYKVEVPASITIDLDTPSCSQLQVTLMTAEDFEENEVLQVKPTFKVLEDKTSTLRVVAGKNDNDEDIEDTVTIGDLKITDELLKFGTYSEGDLDTGSEVAKFNVGETGSNNAKTISTVVDPNMAKTARRAIPDVPNGKTDPSIPAGQKIGTITYACEFVAAESVPQSGD